MTARVPERVKRFAGPLAIVAVALVQFRAVLVGGVYRFEDIAGYFEPLWSAAARAMRAGHWPIWDGGAWSGQPLVTDPQVGIFYPPNWLWLILPVLRAYAISALLHSAFGGIGMYALCRVRGRSRAAATLAGIALAIGGFVVLQTRHLMFVQATAWLPWVIAAGWRWVETRDRKWIAAFGASLGFLFLTGGVSMIYYGIWFAAAVLISQIAVGERKLQSLAGLAIGGMLGLALAAPMLVPMAGHAALSPRALGADYHFASQFAWPHYGFVLTLFLPNVFGDDAAGTWRGGFVQWELAGFYAGMVPFAVAAWWLARGDRKARVERIVLASLAIFCVLLAREGSYAHRIAYHVLPLLSSTRCPARALYVFSFLIPMVGADGLDGIAARIPDRLRDRWLLAGVLLTAADLLIAHRLENPSLPLATAQAATRVDATEFLAEHPGERFINDVHLDHALHNAGMSWGLDGASGYSSLPPWRYLHYLWIANHGAIYPHAQIHDDLSAQGVWRFSSPLVDGLAIRWVLSKGAPNGDGFQRSFAGDDGIAAWENEEALPRAWMIHAVRFVDGEAAAAQALPAIDPHQEAIIESDSRAPAAGNGWDPVDRFQIVSATEISIDLQARAASWVVIATPFYPGWSALLDGQEAPIRPANLALQAVFVEAGSHHLELRYRDPRVGRGFLIAAIGALGLLAVAIFRRRRAV